MRRHTVGIIIALVLCVLAPLNAEAQRPPHVPRLGYLGGSPSSPLLEPFRQELRALSWVEGQNINVDYRWTEGRSEQAPELVAELIRLNVDVIYTQGNNAARAAKQATTKIPVVFTTRADPLATGLVSSLARPAGNLTGLGGGVQPTKRLELLREMVPQISRVAMLWNPENPSHRIQLEDLDRAATILGFTVQRIQVRTPADIDRAFTAMAQEHAKALLVLGDTLFFVQRKRIVDLAAKHRLPAIYNRKEYVKAGGLMSYAANKIEQERRAAVYVHKILKGAQPGDLPVEQPASAELVLNLKTAEALGLVIPPMVRMRADEVLN